MHEAVTATAVHCRGETSHIDLSCWRDPVVERVGFDACGDYPELFWLPIIGPTSTWLLRRLAVMAVLHPLGCTLDVRVTAQSLGLGTDIGSRGTFARSLERLGIFGLIRAREHRYEVRTVVPPLTIKQLARLPEHLQKAHALWSEEDAASAYAEAYAAHSRTGSLTATAAVSASAW